jgi:hypothetical protein
MKNAHIEILEKNKPSFNQHKPVPAATGCCGGPSTNNQDACCKLDEDKKAEGESGCGCNSAGDNTKAKSSCC